MNIMIGDIKMTQPYNNYRKYIEWQIVTKAIENLSHNKDIELTTHKDYVVGYISKQLVDNKTETDLRIKVLLSSNRALWGAITPNLRAITVDYNKELFTLRAYFDKGATEDDQELIDIALAEIIADLGQIIEKFHYQPIELPFPNKMSNLKDWVYMRHEDSNG